MGITLMVEHLSNIWQSPGLDPQHCKNKTKQKRWKQIKCTVVCSSSSAMK
jgi:hypothetical protein